MDSTVPSPVAEDVNEPSSNVCPPKLVLVAMDPDRATLPSNGRDELPETASPPLDRVTARVGNVNPFIDLPVTVADRLKLVLSGREERTSSQTRSARAFGGLASEMPVYATFAGLGFMASLGLPGLSGFWGEVLALLGAFPSYRALTAFAATGLILSAAYHLLALQRVFLGPFAASWRTSPLLDRFGGRFPDVTSREVATLLGISEGTVKIHLHKVYEKLGVDGRLELVLYAQQHRLT